MLEELESLGVQFIVEDGNVKARMEGKMPDELRQRILEHREEVKAAVLQREQTDITDITDTNSHIRYKQTSPIENRKTMSDVSDVSEGESKVTRLPLNGSL